jgi:hypothetical protein
MLKIARLGLILLLASSSAFAADGTRRMKTVFSFDGYSPVGGSPSLGIMGELETLHYLGTSPVMVGAGLSYGSLTPNGSTTTSQFLGADFILGVEKATSGVLFGASMGFGWGFPGFSWTSFKSDQTTALLRPEGYFGFILGDGWRLSLAGGYYDLTQAHNFSGYTFGLRLEHKVEVTTKGVDD